MLQDLTNEPWQIPLVVALGGKTVNANTPWQTLSFTTSKLERSVRCHMPERAVLRNLRINFSDMRSAFSYQLTSFKSSQSVTLLTSIVCLSHVTQNMAPLDWQHNFSAS